MANKDRFDDDEPIRRHTRKPRSGGLLLAVLLIVGVIAGLVAAVLFVIANMDVVEAATDSPEAGFEEFRVALISKDYGKVWDRMSDIERASMTNSLTRLTREDPERFRQHLDKHDKKLFVAMLNDYGTEFGWVWVLEKRFKSAKNVGSNGDIVNYIDSSGLAQRVQMTKGDDGKWRVLMYTLVQQSF